MDSVAGVLEAALSCGHVDLTARCMDFVEVNTAQV